MSNPMTPAPAEIVAWLRGEAKDWGGGMAIVGPMLLTEAADLIENLTAQRDGLAGMVGRLREAIEHALERKSVRHMEDSTDLEVCYSWCPRCKLDAALPLTIPEAVAQIVESKELHQWAIENHVSLWWNTATISNGPWWWRKWNAERWNGRFMTAEEALRAAKEAENAK